MITENYSNWQERRMTEEEKRKILKLEQEELRRLEKGKKKQEKQRISQEMQSKE